MGFKVSKHTKDKIQDLIARQGDGLQVGHSQTRSYTQPQVSIVACGELSDEENMIYEGTVSQKKADFSFEEISDTVYLREFDWNELVPEQHYLAIRVGDHDDGTPMFECQDKGSCPRSDMVCVELMTDASVDCGGIPGKYSYSSRWFKFPRKYVFGDQSPCEDTIPCNTLPDTFFVQLVYVDTSNVEHDLKVDYLKGAGYVTNKVLWRRQQPGAGAWLPTNIPPLTLGHRGQAYDFQADATVTAAMDFLLTYSGGTHHFYINAISTGSAIQCGYSDPAKVIMLFTLQGYGTFGVGESDSFIHIVDPVVGGVPNEIAVPSGFPINFDFSSLSMTPGSAALWTPSSGTLPGKMRIKLTLS